MGIGLWDRESRIKLKITEEEKVDGIDRQQFFTNVATNLVEDSAKNAWNKIKKFFVDLDAKESIRYKTAYEKYLLNTEQKNSKIKTIIYRRAPKDLYSFYVCIGVSYNGENYRN